MSRYGRGMPTTLYVRNISTRCRYDDLKNFFQNYGKIIDITIPLDYYSGMPKGFCFIEFDDPRDAEEAQYRLDRKYFFGREIDVEFARGTRQTAADMRSRDRRFVDDRRGGSRDDRRFDDRGYSRRSRTRSRSRSREYRAGRDYRDARSNKQNRVERSRSREAHSHSRSKSRSVSRNRSPSPRPHARSLSRDSHDQRSNSREMI